MTIEFRKSHCKTYRYSTSDHRWSSLGSVETLPMEIMFKITRHIIWTYQSQYTGWCSISHYPETWAYVIFVFPFTQPEFTNNNSCISTLKMLLTTHRPKHIPANPISASPLSPSPHMMSWQQRSVRFIRRSFLFPKDLQHQAAAHAHTTDTRISPRAPSPTPRLEWCLTTLPRQWDLKAQR